MKQETLFSRYSLLWVIILCYLTPLISLSLYGTLIPHQSTDWNILSLGFLITACGSLVLFWILTRWEESFHNSLKMQRSEHAPIVETSMPSLPIDHEEFDLTKRSLAEAQQTQIRLLEEIDILTEEIHQHALSKEQIKKQSEKLQTELELTKREARQQLEEQQHHIRELQEAIINQKEISEKKQQQVLQLETKVGDLTYEIKTLLQFAEAHSGPLLSNDTPEILPQRPVNHKIEATKEEISFLTNSKHTNQKASQQLKECLDIAQKIKGSQRFGSQIYSFLDSPADSFSIDLRRLCDRLRNETESVILLYSPKDHHLLFASNQIKALTGWSPEKFVQSFPEIVLDESEWKQGISSLNVRSEVQIPLQLKTKSGSHLLTHAVLGMIPTGIFRNHIIAVLYSSNIPENHLITSSAM